MFSWINPGPWLGRHQLLPVALISWIQIKLYPFYFRFWKTWISRFVLAQNPIFQVFAPKKVNFQAFQAFPVTLERLFTIYQPITSHQLSTYFGEFMYKFDLLIFWEFNLPLVNELLIFGFTPEFNRRA